jgi:hypothetical protein
MSISLTPFIDLFYFKICLDKSKAFYITVLSTVHHSYSPFISNKHVNSSITPFKLLIQT